MEGVGGVEGRRGALRRRLCRCRSGLMAPRELLLLLLRLLLLLLLLWR